MTGLDFLDRRDTAYELDSMHREVVDGIDVLAVMDVVKNAASIIKESNSPVLLEFIMYRSKITA